MHFLMMKVSEKLPCYFSFIKYKFYENIYYANSTYIFWAEILPPCGRGVKYGQSFPACRMRRLKGCLPMTARLQRGNTLASCVTSTAMPAQKAANNPKSLVPNPDSTPFTHGATCCWLGCTISPSSSFPSSSPQILPCSPSPPLSTSLSYVHEN